MVAPAESLWGLPGFVELSTPFARVGRTAGTLAAGYGFTEPQNGEATAHHRVIGSLAVGATPWQFLSIGGRAQFRYDAHGPDSFGPDSGSVLDLTPTLVLRAPLRGPFGLGLEARAAFLGSAAVSGVPAPTPEGRLLFGHSGSNHLVSLGAGFRLGQSSNARALADQLRPGDRSALGLSEAHQILIGLGAAYLWDRGAFTAELGWDLGVLDGAPGPSQSPLRATLGLRQGVGEVLTVFGALSGTLPSRAPSRAGDPLVPIEPLLQVILGVTLGTPEPPSAKPAPLVKKVAPPRPLPPPPPEPVGPPPPQFGGVEVTVVDETGHPISDAKVTVELTRDDGTSEARQIPLRELSTYFLTEVPVGEVTVTVEADLLQTATQTVTVNADSTTQIAAKLRKATSVGSQLRGLVRSYDGSGLPARIQVEPGGLTATCGAEGEFSLDLPPGDYQVHIEADGYQRQTRRLRVRKESVTVLNADLQRAH